MNDKILEILKKWSIPAPRMTKARVIPSGRFEDLAKEIQELSTQGVDELELFKFWWNKRNGEFLSISDYDIKKFRQSNLTDDPKGNINP